MTNRKLTISVALALGLPLAGGAYAATPFVGPYVGAQIGYSVYDIDASLPAQGSIEGFSGSGAEGGLYGGWGTQFAPALYGGVEAEYSWSGAEHTTNGFKIEDDSNYGISGRVGWLPSSNTMLYARLGWQRANLEYSIDGLKSDQDHDGFRVGLGAEVAMTGDWLLRMDYAHTMYDDVTIGAAKFEPDNDVFRIGIARQF
jgi:outer membrane immunogenic protein